MCTIFGTLTTTITLGSAVPTKFDAMREAHYMDATRFFPGLAALLPIITAILFASPPALAQQETVLYSFCVNYTSNCSTVVPQYSGTPTGKVKFKNGSKNLGTVALVDGVASLTTSTLRSGSNTITASYDGGADFGGSSMTLTQTVE
jgi:Bacterial Ig-like domain (group 3)